MKSYIYFSKIGFWRKTCAQAFFICRHFSKIDGYTDFGEMSACDFGETSLCRYFCQIGRIASAYSESSSEMIFEKLKYEKL